MAAPDIEAVLTGWAPTEFPDARVCTELPADMTGQMPVIQFARIGGQDMQVAVDRPNVAVDVYDADRIAARTLAHQVWDKMRFTLPGQVTGGAVVSKVRTIGGPVSVPYENTGLRRFSFTVQLFTRAT